MTTAEDRYSKACAESLRFAGPKIQTATLSELVDALHGVELAREEQHVVGWLSGLDHTAWIIADLIRKAREAGRAEAISEIAEGGALSMPGQILVVAPSALPSRDAVVHMLFDQVPDDWDEHDIGILADAFMDLLAGRTVAEVLAPIRAMHQPEEAAYPGERVRCAGCVAGCAWCEADHFHDECPTIRACDKIEACS